MEKIVTDLNGVTCQTGTGELDFAFRVKHAMEEAFILNEARDYGFKGPLGQALTDTLSLPGGKSVRGIFLSAKKVIFHLDWDQKKAELHLDITFYGKGQKNVLGKISMVISGLLYTISFQEI